jgi:hypothetical protein
MDIVSATRVAALTDPERRALTTADPDTGLVTAQPAVRERMQRRGYVYGEGSFSYLTDFGRSLRRYLLDNHQEFHVNGVPWSKVEEITALYLAGKAIEEISHLTRVTGEGVEAALAFRRVLVGC